MHELAYHVAVDGIAIAIIAVGGLGAVVGIGRIAFSLTSTDWDRRTVWLSFVRWLVAGLTLQLAADVVIISFAPSWNTLGQLAATAVIRTFISYFLDREVDEMRALRRVWGQGR